MAYVTRQTIRGKCDRERLVDAATFHPDAAALRDVVSSFRRFTTLAEAIAVCDKLRLTFEERAATHNDGEMAEFWRSQRLHRIFILPLTRSWRVAFDLASLIGPRKY